MNVLPTAIDLLVSQPADAGRAVASPRRQRAARSGRSGRSSQLPLSLPRAARADARPSADRAPAIDAVAAAGAMWAAVSPGAAITRLTPPAEGWPDAFLRPEDVPLVAVGGPVAEGALAAVRLRASDALVIRRVHRLGDHHVRLQPEDRTVASLVLPAAEVDLIGPIVTIVRGVAAAVGSQRRTA